MVQARDGFLWMATRGGVVRFDGKTFQVFNYKNTPGLFRDMAVSIAIGPRGVPWIGTDGGGCGPLENGAFLPLALGKGKRLWSQQNAILTARDGSVWLAGLGQYALIHYDHGAVRAYPESTPQGAPAAGCSALAEDSAGRIWLLSWSGLYLRDKGDQFRIADRIIDGTAMIPAAGGGLWIGTKHGLVHWRVGKSKVYGTKEGLATADVHSICADRNGNVWIGTALGLSRLSNGKITNYGREDGLSNANVGPIVEDREGSLWVATDTGLNRFAPTELTPVDFATARGAAPKISTAIEADDRSAWFATSLGLFRVRNYGITHVGVRDGLPSEDIRTVAEARDGAFYVTTAVGDLYRWRRGRSTPVVAGKKIAQIARVRTGVVAVAGDGGLYAVEGSSARLISRVGDCGWIFSCSVDRHDDLWLATSVGLVRVHDGRPTRFNSGMPPDTHVLSVSEGGSGELWLGTDRGLGRFREGKCRLYATADGLPDDNFYSAQEDGSGGLWLGGTRGLVNVRLADVEALDSHLTRRLPFKLYDDSDGVRHYPVIPGQLKTRDGRLWFLGDKGVTVVDPNHIVHNEHIPFVMIERALADDSALAGKPGESVRPGTNKLEFRYTSTSLAAPERVLFRYRLIGYDRAWVDVGTRRAAYYTNLPPGSYRFEVTACNNDGVWNPVGATYAFTLQPYFFQTQAFRLLALIGLIAVVWFICSLWSRHLRSRNRVLEKRVAHRTAELHSSLDELRESKQALESANAELQTSRLELAANNAELTTMNAELEAANARLEALATTDGMTGIANHRAFQDQMRAVVARASRAENCTTLLLCDVDRFKQYNDSYGHPAGDEVLRLTAALLRDNIREGDFVARYGGEEFAILLPNTGSAEAVEVAERVRLAIENHAFPWRRITISIGVSAPMAGAVAPQALVESADRALYAAKNSGRNRVILGAGECGDGIGVQEWIERSQPDAMHPATEVDDVAELAEGLLKVLNLRDAETKDHSQRVARYTMHLAGQAQEHGFHTFTRLELRDIKLGALLHDIGKVGIPDAILYKADSLTDDEWQVMRSHPMLGAEVLRGCPHFAGAIPIVRSHHERWDGQGYPDGLARQRIPLAARLFAIADALDAMGTNRPYRGAVQYEAIRDEIRAESGRQFDPALVELFVKVAPEVWERLASGTGASAGSQPCELPAAA
ncbi:MAG TPA: diguanylate cyclase [Chthonomonadaceae bacterium]|nr:diguanylate cyclase [Chthonomonadaceae bacterium]